MLINKKFDKILTFCYIHIVLVNAFDMQQCDFTPNLPSYTSDIVLLYCTKQT